MDKLRKVQIVIDILGLPHMLKERVVTELGVYLIVYPHRDLEERIEQGVTEYINAKIIPRIINKVKESVLDSFLEFNELIGGFSDLATESLVEETRDMVVENAEKVMPGLSKIFKDILGSVSIERTSGGPEHIGDILGKIFKGAKIQALRMEDICSEPKDDPICDVCTQNPKKDSKLIN